MGKRKRLSPGMRFYPTNAELVKYYLRRKVLGMKYENDGGIADVDIYKYSPWDLPAKSGMRSKDRKWYFFCPRERKYASGTRLNRSTENGYWKTTGRDRPVQNKNEVVGMIKTLIFHVGKAPRGERTDWVMHEYRLDDKELRERGVVQDTYVICVIFKKDGPGPRNGDQYGPPVEDEEDEDWSDSDSEDEENCNTEANPSGTVPVGQTADQINHASTSSHSTSFPSGFMPESFNYGVTSSVDQIVLSADDACNIFMSMELPRAPNDANNALTAVEDPLALNDASSTPVATEVPPTLNDASSTVRRMEVPQTLNDASVTPMVMEPLKGACSTLMPWEAAQRLNDASNTPMAMIVPLVASDDVDSMLSFFSEDDTLVFDEKIIGQKATDEYLGADFDIGQPCSDGNDIFSGLADLESLDAPSRGIHFSSSGSFEETIAMTTDPFLELLDLDGPLNQIHKSRSFAGRDSQHDIPDRSSSQVDPPRLSDHPTEPSHSTEPNQNAPRGVKPHTDQEPTQSKSEEL